MKIEKMKLYIIQDNKLNKMELNNILTEKYNITKGILFDEVKVPSVLENILYENKYLNDPYYSDNIFDIKKYETYHQFYFFYFDNKFKNPVLTFEGVDTIADVYLNGNIIYYLDNMFIKHSIDLNNLKEKDNLLVIHIRPSIIEGKKYEKVKSSPYMCDELMHIRKKISSFGWDILPRTPLGGIYKDLYINEKHIGLENVYLYSNKNHLSIDIELTDNFNNSSIVINGKCENSTFHIDNNIDGKVIHAECFVPDIKYWNAIGYGDANLYNVEVSLYQNGVLIDSKNIKFGFRDIELKRSSIVEKEGCFNFYINGIKNFILGTNWVPVDALKSYDLDRTYKILDEVVKIGCNAIRCWGGSIYEIDEFYDYCDEHGILVWQDFMMACGTYPQDDDFKNKMKIEVKEVLKRLRNHPSIVLWAGDNECDYMILEHTGMNPNIYNEVTRNTIKNVIDEYDKTRPYIPSSPYIDETAIKYFGKIHTAEDHIWGPRDYFRSDYYRNANCYFASEIGYHGCSSPKALDKFLKTSYPIFKADGTPTSEYLAHASSIVNNMSSQYAYRIRLMSDQVETLFNKNFDNIVDFSKASQISQAEAMKYFIENFRIDRNRNGGIIWWNIMDGWPQISDSVIDYSFIKKLAYYYIKRSQNKTLLAFKEDNHNLKLYFINDLNSKIFINFEVIDAINDEIVLKGTASCNNYSSKEIFSFKNDLTQKYYILKWHFDGNTFINHYVSNIKPISLELYSNTLEKYELLNFEGF